MKKYLFTLLVASLSTSLFAFDSLTPNEIFSAIDGEHDHVGESVPSSVETQRVNFDISAQGSTDLMHEVLSGIDGEYDSTPGDTSRINYSLASSNPDDSSHLDNVLSAIGGSNDY